jgi:cell division protein FtsB
MPARSGDMRVSGERRVPRVARERAARAGRRRWLLLFGFVLVVVVAILANIGPLTHYQDASARLDKVSATVDSLAAQKDELQGDLAKLSETGYLETLARQQLTYARPGEDLYIVTGASGETTGASGQTTGSLSSALPGVGGGISQALDPDGRTAAAASTVTSSGAGETAGTDPAGANDDKGFFEGIISAIRGLF